MANGKRHRALRAVADGGVAHFAGFKAANITSAGSAAVMKNTARWATTVWLPIQR